MEVAAIVVLPTQEEATRSADLNFSFSAAMECGIRRLAFCGVQAMKQAAQSVLEWVEHSITLLGSAVDPLPPTTERRRLLSGGRRRGLLIYDAT